MTMKEAERWTRLQALFHQALDLGEPEREAFLLRNSADDPSLVADVKALLDEDARPDFILDRGLHSVAANMLERSDATPSGPFGPYRIVRRLGEGGMGVVYLAERNDLGAIAAIKILGTHRFHRRAGAFCDERTTARAIESPVHCATPARHPGGRHAVVRHGYVDGLTLTEYCRVHATSLTERLRLFRDVCEAVQHAHQHLVVHRDQAVEYPGQERQHSEAARLWNREATRGLDGRGDQTRTALRLMTPAYAAPEQIRGGRIGIYTDVTRWGSFCMS
jgi:serine/threonine-protein kinase